MLFVKKIFILLAIIFFVSCNSQPEPIIVGKDQCSFCKMMVSDAKFGGEIVTTKNKKYKFDDMHCMLSFLKTKMIEENEVQDVYVANFSSNSHQLINIKTALLLQSNLLKSPMGGNVAAFETEPEMNKIKEEYKATVVSWSQLVK